MSNRGYIKVLFANGQTAPTFEYFNLFYFAYRDAGQGRASTRLLHEYMHALLGNPEDNVDAPLSAKMLKRIPTNLAIIKHAADETATREGNLTALAIPGRFFVVALREPYNITTCQSIDNAAKLFRSLTILETKLLSLLLSAYSKESTAWLSRHYGQMTVSLSGGLNVDR